MGVCESFCDGMHRLVRLFTKFKLDWTTKSASKMTTKNQIIKQSRFVKGDRAKIFNDYVAKLQRAVAKSLIKTQV